MNIHLIRTAPCETDCAALREELLLWAEVNDFVLTEETEARWEFQRGSPWRPLYSFRSQDLPTRVVVRALPRSGKVVCTLHCATWLSIQTAGDEDRFRHLLGCLIAGIRQAGSSQPGHAAADHSSGRSSRAPAADAIVSK
jgi:hypothetical protein